MKWFFTNETCKRWFVTNERASHWKQTIYIASKFEYLRHLQGIIDLGDAQKNAQSGFRAQDWHALIDASTNLLWLPLMAVCEVG
jgi:hypothetical protein